MEGLFTLLIFSIVMAATSFLVGSLPLSFALSPSQLRLVSSVGMGVLVGTSLIVIIPEGIETLYSSALHRTQQEPHNQLLDVRWQNQDTNPSLPHMSTNLRGRSAILDLAVPATYSAWTRSTSPKGMEKIYVQRSEDINEEHKRLDQKDGSQNDGHEQTNDRDHSGDHESSLHVWIGVALVGGFILMYLVDKLPRFASSSKQQRLPHHISLDNLGYDLQRSSSPSHDGGLFERSSSAPSHSFATTIGLVIHAAADGIALGASTFNTNLSLIIFLALLIHKAPASFGLASVLLKQGLSSRAARAHLLIFSLASPIGALMTFLFTQTVGLSFSKDEVTTRWWTGMLLLFSAGTFLYVAMHTMQENDPSSAPKEVFVNGYTDGRDTPQRSKKSMRDLVASVIGMVLPLFLQIGHAH